MDPYVYEGTNILKNKLNIKDEQMLIDIETQFFIANTLDMTSIVEEIDMKSRYSVQQIHKFLFQQIYEWAGEFRTVNIHKSEPVLGGLSVIYSEKGKIKQDLITLFNWSKTVHWDNENKDLANDFAKFMTELWRIHPFREGNTRMTSVFMNLFAKVNELSFNGEILSQYPGYLRKALVLATVQEAPEPQHLLKMLKDALGLLKTEEVELHEDQPNIYKTIKQYDVSTYKQKPFKTFDNE